MKKGDKRQIAEARSELRVNFALVRKKSKIQCTIFQLFNITVVIRPLSTRLIDVGFLFPIPTLLHSSESQVITKGPSLWNEFACPHFGLESSC